MSDYEEDITEEFLNNTRRTYHVTIFNNYKTFKLLHCTLTLVRPDRPRWLTTPLQRVHIPTHAHRSFHTINL